MLNRLKDFAAGSKSKIAMTALVKDVSENDLSIEKNTQNVKLILMKKPDHVLIKIAKNLGISITHGEKIGSKTNYIYTNPFNSLNELTVHDNSSEAVEKKIKFDYRPSRWVVSELDEDALVEEKIKKITYELGLSSEHSFKQISINLQTIQKLNWTSEWLENEEIRVLHQSYRGCQIKSFKKGDDMPDYLKDSICLADYIKNSIEDTDSAFRKEIMVLKHMTSHIEDHVVLQDSKALDDIINS